MLKLVGAILALVVVATPVARADQKVKVYRVGWVTTGHHPFIANFREALRELGYSEGQNLVIEERYADGKTERLPDLVAELLRLKVDILVTAGAAATSAARQTSVPVVFVTGDPVKAGFVSSLARPAGTMTGLALWPTPEIGAKWVELVKEALPRVSRVAALRDPYAGHEQSDAVAAAARSLQLELQVVDARDADGIDRAFQRMIAEHVGAFVPLSSPMFATQKQRIVALAAWNRLPALYEHREFVEAGGLMSYGPDLRDVFRRAAIYVVRILGGAKPGDLPVEQPTKFELVINARTAKALGLTIPQSLLLRADQVIE
jgi:putative tryptophan/tyrosine transport system substrate-binding protein